MKKFLYCMPASNGDVFMSTAVVAGIKIKYPDSKIFFLTKSKYFSLLYGDKNIDRIITFKKSYLSSKSWHKYQLDNEFDAVFAPYTLTQTGYTNWFMGGHGNNLLLLYSKYCNVKVDKFYIRYEITELPEQPYLTIHIGSGKNRWLAKKYNYWQYIVDQLKNDFNIVQIGGEEPLLNGVKDYRHKTRYPQLSYLLKNSICHIGIDSFPMWLAGAIGTNLLILFGNTCANNCGFPSEMQKTTQKLIYLEPEKRYTCGTCCHYKTCIVNKEEPCINLITPEQVLEEFSENIINENIIKKEW